MKSSKKENAASTRTITAYVVAGIIIFTMVFSVFASLVYAIK
jgi:hypothetical protein